MCVSYDRSGYNRWRDSMKPTQILAKLCKEAKLDPPVYLNGTVKIGAKTFCLQNNTDDTVEWYCAKGECDDEEPSKRDYVR